MLLSVISFNLSVSTYKEFYFYTQFNDNDYNCDYYYITIVIVRDSNAILRNYEKNIIPTINRTENLK